MTQIICFMLGFTLKVVSSQVTSLISYNILVLKLHNHIENVNNTQELSITENMFVNKWKKKL